MNDALLFVPLGGVGEIGMNVYLYGLKNRWLMVDLGISFTDERLPGAELVLPEIGWIAERRHKLAGIVLTHAHEDHIGAVPYLWPQLECPIYCTRFTHAVLRRKLDDNNCLKVNDIHEIPINTNFEIEEFRCRFINVTHSIPDANSLAIETDYGRVLHTGDWKLDPAPTLGPPTGIKEFEEFGRQNVLAMIADSTNVLNSGTSGSESEVRDSLCKLIKQQRGRVVLTTFASNIARLQTAMFAAREAGREIVIVGRSMHRMMDAAREIGLHDESLMPIDEHEARMLAPDKLLYLVTGSQGEPRAALMRIAQNNHPAVKLEPGDTAIFSSKVIPGNERTLYQLHNQLVDSGVEVITEEDHFVHVSGHPCRDEVEQMYRWIKPEIAVPVHGEARHLHAHARLADDLNVPHSFVLRNGDMLKLGPGDPVVLGEIPVGRKVLEASELVDAEDELYRTRRRLMSHGTIFAVIVLDLSGSLLALPSLKALGAMEMASFSEVLLEVKDAIADAVENIPDHDIDDDEKVAAAARTAIRRTLSLPRFKRPIVEVEVVRIEHNDLEAQENQLGVA